jgi:hypothetical protein
VSAVEPTTKTSVYGADVCPQIATVFFSVAPAREGDGLGKGRGISPTFFSRAHVGVWAWHTRFDSAPVHVPLPFVPATTEQTTHGNERHDATARIR